MDKLIVDRNQAKEIKKGKCDLVLNMRKKDGFTHEYLANKKFLNKVFWVAEPLCRIRRGEEKYVKHFSCDPVPEGWERYTLDRPGSRVSFGDHRHLVECKNVQYFAHGAGDMFSVLVTLEILNG